MAAEAYAPLLYFLADGAAFPSLAREDGFRPPTKQPVVGPKNLNGVLTTSCRFLGDLSYDPEFQRWVSVPTEGPGSVWLGVDARGVVAPDLFARTAQRPGHKVVMGDGHAWEIPVARLFLGGSGLPRRRVLTDDGASVWEVEQAYRQLSSYADRIWNQENGGGVVIADAEVDLFCGEALAVNYRLGAREAIALGLFTDESMRGVLRALIDLPTAERVLAAQKKSAPIAGA